ncbi:ATP-binding protein [Actinoplanes sp. NPDC049599]|uniref:ATP-binding protein n=1 Tax=Actinoplanes sp. NPDC049599 TaxID=3363903 RepID=UPI0037B880DA
MHGEIKPPYLIDRVPAGAGSSVVVTADVSAGIIEVAVHGRWSPGLRMQAWAAVTKCFAEYPETVLVDLHDLADPLAASAPAWWTMGMTGARMSPPIVVVVSLPPATPLAARLNRLGAKRYLPVYATTPEARAAAMNRPPLTERIQLTLSPHPGAPKLACELIAGACQAWRLPRLLHPAGLIIAELVGNAVKHANTEIVVTVSRRGTGIHLTVTDGDPRLPVPTDPPDHRRGLRRVHDTATIWGALPTETGKVVWALVRPGQGTSVRDSPGDS